MQGLDSTIGEESHLMELKLLSITFPSVFRDLQMQRQSYYSSSKHKIIESAFPLFKNYYYHRLYNFIKNDYLGHVYEPKFLPVSKSSKADFLKQLFLEENKTIE